MRRNWKRKKKKRASYRNREGNRAQTRVRLPFAVFTDEQCLCVKHMLTHTSRTKGMTSETGGEVCDAPAWPVCTSSWCAVPCSVVPDASWFRFIRFNQHLIYTWDANGIQFISAEETQQRFSGREINLCLFGPARVCHSAARRLVLMLQRWKNGGWGTCFLKCCIYLFFFFFWLDKGNEKFFPLLAKCVVSIRANEL